MNENDFREAMRSGLGRAILYARDHDVSAFRDTILDACLHTCAVDPPSEGTRAPYMVCLVDLTPGREFYHGEVLHSLRNSADDSDTVHRFRFASILAINGDERARQAMYEHFNPGPRHAESTGVDFVQMDGLDGLLFAAGIVGQLLRDPSMEVDHGFLASHAIHEFGEEPVLSALRDAGKNDPNVETYLGCKQNFRDPLALTIPDTEHSVPEARWITMAKVTHGHYVLVLHTFEQLDEWTGRIRVISARRPTRAEARDYEERQ